MIFEPLSNIGLNLKIKNKVRFQAASGLSLLIGAFGDTIRWRVSVVIDGLVETPGKQTRMGLFRRGTLP
jgi:hypothetical protein